jgi:hypothetical protein
VGGNTSPIAIGQTFTATWSVDSTVAARTGSTSNQAVFDALLSLNVSIGTYSASTPGPQEIQVDHDVAGFDDRYGIVSTSFSGLTGPLNGSDLNLFFLNLKDSSKTVFSDALILPLALSLASFDSTAFAFFFSDDSFISGHLTDLSSVSPVPLPAALPLFASALGAMSFLGWRRKRKAAALAAANV